MMEQQPKQTYEFGPYRLDPTQRVLLKDGETVSLTPKAFDVLLLLVKSHGQIVAKSDVMDRVWTDTFVEESNLTVYIHALRKALGEGPGQHHYIATVPGRGYQFVASVREITDEGVDLIVKEREHTHVVIEEESSETDRAAQVRPWTDLAVRRRRLKQRLIAACVVLFILLAAGAVWKLWPRPVHRVSLASLQLTQLASWKTEPGTPAPTATARFSRDGKMIAFSLATSGRSNIWIKQTLGGDRFQITRGDWIDMTPVWSPDGEQIAFISNRGGQYGIWVSLSHGGTATFLKPLDGASKALRHWSKDRETIYYELDHNLYALNIVSKSTRQLTAFDPAKAFTRDFSVSLDESRIAYADSQDGRFDIWTMPLEGGTPRRVTNDAYNDLYPAWSADGSKIIYSSDRGPAYQLCVAYLDGHAPEQITFTTSDCVAPDVATDGTRILFTTIKEESDLWGVKADGGDEFEITSKVGLEIWPEAAPDGKSIMFQTVSGSERLTTSVISAKTLSPGDQEVQLVPEGFDPHWSPDGSKVAFLRFAETRFNLWAINATGGEAVQLTTDGMKPRSFKLIPLNRSQDGGYSWSPDSSKIAYCAVTADQRNIWTVSADGLVRSKISNGTDPSRVFTRPLWSRDGARIASVLEPRAPAPEGNNSWSLWVSGLESVFQHSFYLWLLGWSAADDGLIVASTEDQDGSRLTDIALLQISLDGSSRPIARLQLAYPDNLELSPDGRFIAFVSRQDGWDNVYMIAAGGGPKIKLTTNTDPRLYLSTLNWSPDGKVIYYGKQTRSSEVSMIDNFK